MKSRKALKEAYKQQKALMGIFQIRNKVTGKVLIEGSKDIPARWNRIRMELKFGNHRNKALQKDWQQQSAEDFEISILSKYTVEEGENVNLNEELSTLKEMVIEEMELTNILKY